MIGKILQKKLGNLLMSPRASNYEDTNFRINSTATDSLKLNDSYYRDWTLSYSPADSPELFQGYPEPLLHVATACCVIFILLGIPGNLGTIVALYRCKKVRNATAVFIINLSFSDLMFCCFNLPLAASTFYYRAWRHGTLLCQLFPLLRYGLLAVSLFTVLAITINRYVMIGHPTLYPKLYRSEYLGLMVACTWVSGFGALGATWYGAWGQFGLDPEIGSCTILPDRNGNSPKTFLFLVAFVIPCISIIVCYARIFYIVRKTALKSRSAPRAPIPSSKPSTDVSKCKSSSCEDSAIGTSTTAGVSTDRSSSVYLDLRLSPAHLQTEIQQNLINARADRYIIKAERVHFAEQKVSKDKQVKRAHSDSKLNVSERRPLCQHRKSIEVHQKKYYISSSPVSPVYTQAEKSVETHLMVPPIIIRSGDDISTSCSIDETNNSSSFRSPNLKKQKRMASMLKSHGSPWKAKVSSHQQPGKMTAKDKKLLKMILVIFISFLVCYLPITISKTFHNIIEIHMLNIAGYILIYLTTCMNPIIYVVMSSEYRQAYKNLLTCKTGDHQSQQNRSGSQK